MSDYQMYIDGKWCEAASGATHDAINPATGAFQELRMLDGHRTGERVSVQSEKIEQERVAALEPVTAEEFRAEGWAKARETLPALLTRHRTTATTGSLSISSLPGV